MQGRLLAFESAGGGGDGFEDEVGGWGGRDRVGPGRERPGGGLSRVGLGWCCGCEGDGMVVPEGLTPLLGSASWEPRIEVMKLRGRFAWEWLLRVR